MKLFKYISLVIIVAIFVNCEKEKSLMEGDSIPEIVSITASPDTINFGDDYSTIVCTATGGGLEYEWEVDLGDIFPTETPGTVQFSGSACCVGLKEIKCTVRNSLGEAKGSVEVFILEPPL